MNTERTEKFVNAIACELEEGGLRQVSGTSLRRTLATAVSAALPLLHPAELAEQQGVWNDSARLECLESWAREPGGLLLHAESETGRRGLGLGENCGNRTLAQAIDGCATHAEKDSFAALAATGKQQVGEASYHPAQRQADIEGRIEPSARELEGLHDEQAGEVQGDALALIGSNLRSLASLVRQFATDADGVVVIANMQCEIKHAQELLASALAARQPGAQTVWVEVRREDDQTFPRVMKQDQAEAFLRTCNVRPIPTIHALYAAPPAQGIDLGQLWEPIKEAVHTALSAHMMGISQKKRESVAVYVARLLRDGQRDAAPGVGS